jgi:hypothetical protein
VSEEQISLREFYEARERVVRLEAQREGAEKALDLVADGLKAKIQAQATLLFLGLGFMTLMLGIATLAVTLFLKGH